MTPHNAIVTEPTPCRGNCGNILRPSKTRITDYPGTSLHRSGGYCKPCIERTQCGGEIRSPRFARMGSTPKNCAQCGHKMRPHNGKVAEFPGTYRHIGGGYCARCLSLGQIEITDPEGIRPSFDETQARASLEAWLADRARRLDNVHHFRADARHTELVAA